MTFSRIFAARIGVGIGIMGATWIGVAIGQVVANATAPAVAPKVQRAAIAAASPPASKPRAVSVSGPTPPNADAPYVVKRVLDIPTPFRHGDHYWDDAGVPDGPLVITVDLRAQTLSVFRAGYEIGTAVILYGHDTKPTPTGVFNITQKDADHISNLYDAPMPFMLRLTNDGISIHGSATMRPDAATHGCVGVPTPFARKLFRAVKLGDRVIVTNGEMLSVGKAITAA